MRIIVCTWYAQIISQEMEMLQDDRVDVAALFEAGNETNQSGKYKPNPALLQWSSERTLTLCERCRAIDWRSLVSKELPSDWSSTEIAQGLLNSLRLSQCGFCKFLWNMIKTHSIEFGKLLHHDEEGCYEEVEDYQLSITNTRNQVTQLFGPLYLRLTTSILKDLQPDQMIIGVDTGKEDGTVNLCTVAQVSELVDYAIIKNWLGACSVHHEETCHPLPWKHVDGFRLIDCEQRRIVDTTQSSTPEYVALSYVWGSPTNSKDNGSNYDGDMKTLPRTISDAILVTLSLGFRYLWCDRYCIRNENAVEKHKQIAAMAQIYGSANLTIIATAGEDPSHGLPGVSTKRKVQHPDFKHDQWSFIGSLPSPVHRIEASKWSSRGWTYQEGFLSHQRLFFTDDQVYFHCQELVAWEGQPTILTVLNDQPNAIYKTPPGSLWEADNLSGHITEYSRRHLTYPDDILKAFTGILSAHESAWRPTYSYFGIPILHYNYKEQIYGMAQYTIGFFRGLMWQPRSKEAAKRRIGHPSWSWIGWHTEVEFPCLSAKIMAAELGVVLYTRKNHSIELRQYIENFRPFKIKEADMSHQILLYCWSIPFRFVEMDEELVVEYSIANAKQYGCLLPLDEDCNLDEDEFLGLYICGREAEFPVLLFRKLNHHWQRCGSFIFQKIKGRLCVRCHGLLDNGDDRSCPLSPYCHNVQFIKQRIIIA